MSRPKREKVIGAWIKLHNEKLHDLHPSPIIRVIKARGLRLISHASGI